MISKGIKKYLLNPSLGLLIGVLFLSLFYFTDNLFYSFIISIIVSAVSDLTLKFGAKSRICGLFFFINSCALIGTLLLWLILSDTKIYNLFYLVVYEVLLVVIIFIADLSKNQIIYFCRKENNAIQKTYLSEFFHIAKIVQYCIIFHLFLVLLYDNFIVNLTRLNELGTFIYFLFPIAILLSIIVYEQIKIRNIVKLLRKEQWLPIVNESGEVTGRIARSVSVRMKNRNLHPVIRTALVYKGALYLKKRSSTLVLDPSMYDHPFEKYMLFNHSVDEALKNAFAEAVGVNDLPNKFLLKYTYKTDITNRLIFLFVSRLDTKEQVESLNLSDGKFWTPKQIDDSFAEEGLFSECFQLEYEYLKNTVLLSESQKKKNPNTESAE